MRYHYCYREGRKFADEEQTLLDKEYPFVNTNSLPAGGQLESHKHHSDNTHLIERGSMQLGVASNRPTTHRSYKKGELIPMLKGVEYEAAAGKEGCTFAEGHRSLSFTSVERFVARGTFQRVYREQCSAAWLATHEVFSVEKPTNTHR